LLNSEPPALANSIEANMQYRIAAVSFLNTVPLIDWFSTPGSADVALVRALPSRLASLLEAGEADVALLPVVELFRGRAAGIIPGSGIACRGPVDTVKLYYNGDLATLRKIHVDRGSRTSVALLKVLLAERYGYEPPCEEFEPQADMVPAPGEGHLVIGDRCFEYEAPGSKSATAGSAIWDLGEAWLELTDLPFVFAIWCASGDLLPRVGAAGIAELTEILLQARQYGQANLGTIAAREAESYARFDDSRANRDALLYYFQQSLRFEIGAEEMAGLHHFHKLCIKHGLVPRGPAPVVL
jgi:chorismate dehydratase